jgi:hypothetical protein
MRYLFLALAACSPSPALRLESTDLYAAGDSPSFVLADVNGDGLSDLVTSFDGTADRGVTVRDGSLNGSFGAAKRVLVGSIRLAPFDVDADGTMDLVVSDGQHLGVLPEGHGPFRVLGACRESVLGATPDGVLTTNGTDLVMHSWDVELAKYLEIAPLVPLAVQDIDGDGLADIIGMALGQASIRHGTHDGFGAVHVLREADGLAITDVDGDGTADVVTWKKHDAFAWHGNGWPIATFTVPSDVTALAAGDLDEDGHPEIVVASHEQLAIVDRGPIEGAWKDIRELAVEKGRVLIADAGTRTIAVVRPSLPATPRMR